MNSPNVDRTFDKTALICAIVAFLFIVVVDAVEEITLVEDCLLYLAIFLTANKVVLHRL